MMRALIACTLTLLATAAPAQHQHPPQDQALHEQFYSNWMIPNGGRPRQQSCCNKKDCAPVIAVRRNGNVFEAQREKDGRWLKIPPSKVEGDQSDPRESPDGRSHMCSNETNVICFVFGSGQ